MEPEASQHGGVARMAGLMAIAMASGFAGLGYEIVWTRLLANILGHEFIAVLSVLAGFFAGLALGSAIFGKRIASSPDPVRWYAGLEFVIGLWALALIWVLPAMGWVVPILIPADAAPFSQWVVAFALPMLLLLPAAAALGATLPALDAILLSHFHEKRGLGLVYAANTFGAVLGTLGTTFVIMPAAGLTRTLLLCAAISAACAIFMRVVVRRRPLSAHNRSTPQSSTGPNLVSLFFTGLLGIGFEVLAVRTVSQILENTVYTFAALLSVYLLGTAIGASIYGHMARKLPSRPNTGWLAVCASLACASGTIALGYANTIAADLLEILPRSMSGAVMAELALATAVFLAPTIAMGALFTHLIQDYREKAGNLGPALAVNTAGAAIAPILFGPLLMPLLGAKTALVLIALGYSAIGPVNFRREAVPRLAAAAAALLLFALPLSLRFIQVPPDGELLWHRDGVMASVSVVRNGAGDAMLEVNNHFRMGGTASIESDYREADIPLLLHPAPKHALFLGLGTGTTISAAADHPGLLLDGVELVPEVVESFPLFEKSAPNIGHSPNIRMHIADARRFVRGTVNRYDVVVADVYHPWVDGTAALYTREHFSAIRSILTKDGLFCQWLPLHQLDLPTLRLIVRTFQSEFPHARIYLAQFSLRTPLIALVGTVSGRKFPQNWLDHRVRDGRLARRLAEVDLASDTRLFGLMLGDEKDLAEFSGRGPLNTDDRPIVAFEAPRAAYVAGDTPAERLLALANAMHPVPYAVLETNATVEQHRLANYWRARNRYLALGVHTMETKEPLDPVRELGPKLIDIVRLSPDFDSAYNPALVMARQLAMAEPEAGRRMLQSLEQANPARPEAHQLLVALQDRLRY